MGTEGTADTILNGARITAQADQNLSNAIIGGFNNLSNSFKERTNIYQQMVNSTLKVKELEVDAWFKNRDLELQKRELDIREAQNIAEIQYKKDDLNARSARARKEASLAPLVSAVGIEANVIQDEQKQIQKDLEAQQMLLTGKFFDKEKGRNVIVAPSLRKGTPEYETAQTNIAALNSKLQSSVARGRKITDAATKMTIGVEPNSIIKDLWPDAQIKEEPQQNFRFPDRPGPNPSLPGVEPLESFYNLDENGDILSGKVPQENYPSPLDQEEPLTQQPKTNFGPLRANQNPTYDTREEYDMVVGELIAQAGEKEPFNINIAREYESRLDPKELEVLKADRNVTLKDAYVAIGEAMANRYERNPTTDQEKVIERKLELYKGQLLSLGEDPKKVDLAVRRADLAIIKFRQTKAYKEVEESDGGNERTLAIVGHLQEEAERVYGNPEKIQEPVKKPSAFDEAKDNAIKVISSDGSFGPETKGDTLRGLANQFKDKFISPQKNMATGNPYPVNDEYVKFINSFDENPEAFGISKREESTTDAPFGDMVDVGTPLTDKEIKALIKQRKEIILNDPEKAYAFWLEKERKSQTEGSRVFKFSK